MDERVRAALAGAGFEVRDDGADFDGGQLRYLVVRVVDGVYTIEIEELRGDEGYAAEELRTTSADELIAAIPRWVAWAREVEAPKPKTLWTRLLGYFGRP